MDNARFGVPAKAILGEQMIRTITFEEFRLGTVRLLYISSALVVLFSSGCSRLSRPKNMRSVTITMERSDCQLLCPVYQVTIRGAGYADYNGVKGVPTRGHIQSEVSQDAILSILRELDDAKFMSLDEKKFERWSDTGLVTISLEEDGTHKTVTSSRADNVSDPPTDLLSKNTYVKRQWAFLRVADQIDQSVGTGKWTQCSPSCTMLLKMPFLWGVRGEDGASILLTAIETRRNFSIASSTFSPETMVEAGMDVNQSDKKGVTPLMAAAKNRNTSLIRDLLAHNADPTLKDVRGFTAKDYTKDPEIRSLLSGNPL